MLCWDHKTIFVVGRCTLMILIVIYCFGPFSWETVSMTPPAAMGAPCSGMKSLVQLGLGQPVFWYPSVYTTTKKSKFNSRHGESNKVQHCVIHTHRPPNSQMGKRIAVTTLAQPSTRRATYISHIIHLYACDGVQHQPSTLRMHACDGDLGTWITLTS